MADLSIGTTIGGSVAYHAGNYFPTKADVGLNLVNNWGASDSYTTASSTTYATSKAVKDAYDAAISAAASSVDWSGVTNKPSTFPPSGHTHTIANVTGLQAALDTKIDSSMVSTTGTWAGLIGKIPQITTLGGFEVARYQDFHTDNSTADYDFRWDCSANSMLRGSGDLDIAGVVYGAKVQARAANAISELHSPGVVAFANVATSAGVLETWQTNGNGVASKTFNRQYQDGTYWINGGLWATNFAHGYANQPGLRAPVTVDMGTVGGASDYYPMIRQLSVASGYGYTTAVDFGTLRSGGAAWGQGVIRIGSHESSSHPQAIFYFDTGGNFTAPGNVTAYSDERLKTNFADITDALAKLDEVRCMTFDRTDRELRQAGVIAQDIQKVLPEAVIEGTDGFLSVSYGALVALAIKAIKELKTRVEELERNG